MVKQLKKVLIIFLIMLIIFDFVCASNSSLATSKTQDLTPELLNKMTGLTGGLVSILIWIPKLLMFIAAYFLDKALYLLATTEGGGNGFLGSITAYDIFFNKYKLLDINFFDLNVGSGSTIVYPIRANVAKWFIFMRRIATAILLVILVYVGIRMALSTVSSEKAKYKEMLINWAISLILIYVIQYMAIFIIYLNDAIVNGLAELSTSVISNGTENMTTIKQVNTKIATLAAVGVGIPGATAAVVYVTMIFTTIAFFIAYLNRIIKVAFLLIISPLITITYSIDKMKDNKAQALAKWLKEFLFTILIQPFHCIMYLTFTNAAFELMKPYLTNKVTNPIGVMKTFADSFVVSSEYNLLATSVLVIISLVFIKQAESVISRIFGFEEQAKGVSFGAGMAMGIMAVQNAHKIGKSTRIGLNKTKEAAKFAAKAVPHDLGLLKNSKIGQNVAQKLQSMGSNRSTAGLSGGTSTSKSSSRTTTNTKNPTKRQRKITGFKKKLADNRKKFKESRFGKISNWAGGKMRNQIGKALGGMAAIAAIANGDGPFTAFAEGGAMREGVDAFLDTGESAYARDASYYVGETEKSEYKERNAAYESKIVDGIDPAERAVKESGFDSISDFREKQLADSEMFDGMGYAERYERISQLEAEKAEAESRGETFGSEKERELTRLKGSNFNMEELKKLAEAEDIVAERDELDNFFKPEAIAERLRNKKYGPSKSQVNAAKKELTQMIRKMINKDSIRGDYSATHKVTEQESKYAEKLEKEIEQSLSRAILSHKPLDDKRMNNIIKKYLGVSKEDSPSVYKEAREKLEKMKQIMLDQRIAEAFQMQAQAYGDEEKFMRKAGLFASRRVTFDDDDDDI